MRVCIFLSSLGSGGAERVAVRVAGWLRDANHEVQLLTLAGSDADFYECPRGVSRRGLERMAPSRRLSGSILANLGRARAVRVAIKKFRADLVISLVDRTNVLMLISTVGLRCRKIISERADPEFDSIGRGWTWLRQRLYPIADLHVSQSSYLSEWISERFPNLPCYVIGNPAVSTGPAMARLIPSYQSGLRFVAVGRLCRQKGFDLLVEAFSRARPFFRERATLTIHGEGPDRQNLEARVRELGIFEQVRFPGISQNIAKAYGCADAFILSSRWEGFPNVLVEAMVAGLPTIVSRCRGGTIDVLRSEAASFALEFAPGDIDGLAEAMITMERDAPLRDRLSKASLICAARYDEASIAAQWVAIAKGAG